MQENQSTCSNAVEVEPIQIQFSKLLKLDAEDISAKIAEISKRLDAPDPHMLRIYATSLLRIAILERVLESPMFQANASGTLSLHPIHELHERERKFIERMQKQLIAKSNGNDSPNQGEGLFR